MQRWIEEPDRGRMSLQFPELLKVLISLALLAVEGLLNQHLDDFGRGSRDLARINFASRTVDGEEVSLLVGCAIDSHGFGDVIDLQRRCATNTYFPHLAGNERSVGTD